MVGSRLPGVGLEGDLGVTDSGMASMRRPMTAGGARKRRAASKYMLCAGPSKASLVAVQPAMTVASHRE